MDRKRKIFWARVAAAVVTVTSIWLFAPWRAGLHYFAPLADTLQEELERGAGTELNGVIVYAKTGDAPGQSFAAGWHDRVAQIPAKPDALFKIASIAKLYNASALTKLVAAGTLSLDDTLAERLPELAGRIENADTITLRMMVRHRSGIPNFTDHPDFDWGSSTLNVMDMILDQPADFAPDSDYAYSNTNYLLLHRIMSAALGYPHTDYIRAELLAPLGLTQTYFSVDEVPAADLMSGYHVGYDDDFKALDQGYVATARDVGIFVKALNDGSLFTEREQAIYSRIYEYEHTGWVLGYQSTARYYPDMETVVILFTNTTGGESILMKDVVYSRVVDILRRDLGGDF